MNTTAAEMRPLATASLDDLVAELTLAEKCALVSGATFWGTTAIPRIGLASMTLSDGPAGVRGRVWSEKSPSYALPSATAIAAAFDDSVAERLGRLIGDEARRKGIDVVLGPTVNLHRSPLGGRNFEAFSEDPVLTGRTGAAMVRGIQSRGVAACAKHFLLNDAETDRFDVDCRASEDTVRRVYAAAFEPLVREAAVQTVMTSYNSVDGVRATESTRLDDLLRGEWGFEGVALSDWGAVRSVAAAFAAGTDLAMPGPDTPWSAGLEAAVLAGEIDVDLVDRRVRRLLGLAARVGALVTDERGASVHRSAAAERDDRDAVRELLTDAAARAAVLLRNDVGATPGSPILPFHGGIRRIAVFGAHAVRMRTGGGGSASVVPEHTTDFLAGIEDAFPAAEVRWSVGADPFAYFPDGIAHIEDARVDVEFVDADGVVIGSEERASLDLVYGLGYPDGLDAARVAEIHVNAVLMPGRWNLECAAVGDVRLTLDGVATIDEQLHAAPGDEIGSLSAPPKTRATVSISDAAVLHVRYTPQRDMIAALRVGIVPEGTGVDAEEVAALVDWADAAVVVVGTTELDESEGFDRASLHLPGDQDALVETVARSDVPTVVVINAGAPVATPWRENVEAILLMHFPGQEGGAALGRILSGRAEPTGRLTTTWPSGDHVAVPPVDPVDGLLVYEEGEAFGYRARRHPGDVAYAFGEGQGFASWRLDDVQRVSRTRVRATLTVDAAGTARPESGVFVQHVQLYALRDGAHCTVDDTRVRFLASSRIELVAGETALVDMDVDPAVWNRILAPDEEIELALGFSSHDLTRAAPHPRADHLATTQEDS
ncbi:beta-glucosidase [Microbacterium sp. SORGH_AS 1204]|uniref:glycoside hydrolase family 3 protein n=1 Tax=Microbacterium sp. SORGH_AS_1204 TaxID=3041785 RepID=UPI002794069C|nr:glycoside hydrolase family 3 protein [Microbacterium sp. SORGH_AS_1204]MDQ1136308.1 beta-glucosidase [Microbacterium sp. SORGH_AS_1204]